LADRGEQTFLYDASQVCIPGSLPATGVTFPSTRIDDFVLGWIDVSMVSLGAYLSP